MKIEKVLGELEKLFEEWGLSTDDWVLTGPYAFRLQEYKVKPRKGHLNTLINKDKLWWKSHGIDAFPPRDSKELKQFKKWMKTTGFDTDLIPKTSKEMVNIKRNYSLLHTLPNGRTIRLATMEGELKEFEEFVLPQCTSEGLGIEKGKYMLDVVRRFKKAAQSKGDFAAVNLARRILKKYSFLEKKQEKPSYSGRALKGKCAFKGKVQGKVRVILGARKAGRLRKGEILVTEMTSPKFTIVITRAAGIITDGGGQLCHAAILAREFEIPCVVGTKVATKVLKDGDLIEVDAEKGIVRKLK